MPIININGRKVTVDDSFLSLHPEEQDRTVDEIAAQIGAPEDGPATQSETPKAGGRHLTYEEGLAEMERERLSGREGEAGAGLTAAIGDLPIVGPALLGGAQRIAAGIGSAIDGEDYETNLKQARRATETAQQENPVARVAGGVGGNLALMGGVGSTALGARALGITGPSLMARAGISAASGGVISGADAAARGGNAENVAGSAAIGGAISGAIPLVGAGLSAAGRAVADRVYPTINAIRNPTQEASRRVGLALRRDAANPQSIMSGADEAVARQNSIPVLNADRGGETTRALARSVANQSPEARAIIENTASDRFGAQSVRASTFINRITGGNADDLAYQESLKATARAVNKPAYDAAFKAPEAQQVFTPRLQQLMQSPSFRRAVDMVPTRSADRGAVAGFKQIGNPFAKNSQDAYVLRRAANGQQVTPTLEFWNQVKINLDDRIGVARRSGNNQMAADLMGLKTALVDELDGLVPAYKTARQGAAAFFGAEDALEAGKKFAGTPRLVPEAKKAFQSFKPAEKKAFATGYASELIDRIKASGDRTNVINSVFKSQSSRESMELVFGPQTMKEIEAYVRVEDLVDRLRGAMGNSTTARQLVELGIGAGGGAYMTGDWTGALAGAAVARGARFAGQRVDAKVMEQVAKLLVSDNRGNLSLAVRQAAANPAYMAALERLSNALAVPARVGAQQAAQ